MIRICASLHVLLLLHLRFVSSQDDWHFEGRNIARSRHTSQEPEIDKLWAPAARAVDGNNDNVFSHNSCTHTTEGRYHTASWRVMFDEDSYITGIIIYNRNSLKERLKNFQVIGLRPPADPIPLYDDRNKHAHNKGIIKLTFNGTTAVNGVNISLPLREHAILTLCEVLVYAAPRPACALVSRQQRHGHVEIYNDTGRAINYKNTVGTVIKFSCDEHFHISGSPFIVCLSSGQYNSSFPSCTATCKNLPRPAHGKISPASYRDLGNRAVTVTCYEGYLPPSYSIICKNGVWNDTVHLCISVRCDLPEKPANGDYQYSRGYINSPSTLPFGSEITVICNNGYESSNGRQKRTCQRDKTWSGQELICKKVKCPYPGNVIHGAYLFKNGSKYLSGCAFFETILTSTCDRNYEIGSPVARTCTRDRTWSGEQLVCKIVTCEHPGSISNGFYVALKHDRVVREQGTLKPYIKDTLNVSSEIQVVCLPGSVIKPPAHSVRRCLESGKWSGESPMCVPVKCKWPLHLNGGNYAPSDNVTSNGLAYKTVLTATCNDMFKLSDSYQTRHCDEKGDWDTEPVAPVCEPLCKLPNLTNGMFPNSTSAHYYRIGTVLRVTCNTEYFVMPDSAHITCQNKHQWNASPNCNGGKSEAKQSSDAGLIGGVSAAAVIVVVASLVFAFFFYRRRHGINNEAKVPKKYTDLKKRETGSGVSLNASGAEYAEIGENGNDNDYAMVRETEFSARQSTTDSAPRIKPARNKSQTTPDPVHIEQPSKPSITSSSLDQPDQAYYSFTDADKIPKTAIRLKDLSDLVLTGDSAKETFEKQFKSLPRGMTEAHVAAMQLQNRGKNRYKNIYAYDETRVILDTDADSQSDYINACYVHGFNKTQQYIASQGPTQEILADFWRMIWQTDSCKIVMLTNLTEEGKRKCEQYWPDDGSHTYGRISVSTKKTEMFSQFIIRSLTIQHADSSTEKTVTQFHFTAWPDKGVPKYASSVVQFLSKVKHAPVSGKGPIVVHCSAGIGRTGTFIALDYLTEQAKTLEYVDVVGSVEAMRRQRVNLVQTLDQYIFVHHALVESLMLSTTALPASRFAETFQKLLQIDPLKKKRAICIEFENLKNMSPLVEEYQYVSSKLVNNRCKNRYSNVLPVEDFMPSLSASGEDDDATYINAVFLPSYKEKNAFVITQTPLETTKEEFWQLVWEHDIRTLVMMNTREEAMESEVYWPEEGQPIIFGHIKITNDHAEEIDKHQVVSLSVTKYHVTRHVKQIQCGGWHSNQSLPESPVIILSLMDLVQSWQQQTGHHTVLVHCMNGADKSGLYCVISAVIERMKIEQDVALSHVIVDMRNAREQIIPSVEQYQLCHEAVLAFMQQYDTYSNFTS